LELCLFNGRAERRHSRKIVLSIAIDAHVLEPEILDLVLGRLQRVFVTLDLLVEELHSALRILALVAEARLHEYIEQRLNDLSRPCRVRIAIRDRIKVRADDSTELDRLHDAV